jgi:hypothetical protein
LQELMRGKRRYFIQKQKEREKLKSATGTA